VKHRLRKKGRIAVGGKGNSNAQYVRGRAKKKWALIRLKQWRASG